MKKLPTISSFEITKTTQSSVFVAVNLLSITMSSSRATTAIYLGTWIASILRSLLHQYGAITVVPALHGCVLITSKTSYQASILLLSKAPTKFNQRAAAHTKFVVPEKPMLLLQLSAVASGTTVLSRSSLMSVRRRPELRRTRRGKLSIVTTRMVSSWTSFTRPNCESDDSLSRIPTNEGSEPANKPLKPNKYWHRSSLAPYRTIALLPLSKSPKHSRHRLRSALFLSAKLPWALHDWLSLIRRSIRTRCRTLSAHSL